MVATKSSLRDLAAKAKSSPTLAAANTPQTGNRIVEVDPDLVHAGGLQDRIEVDQVDIEALAKSIKTAGQKVPILVRPHPDRPGEYQIVAGRRRLTACRLASLTVRAEIQDLDDRDLILGQAIENISRENLSYIERARLAVRMVDQAHLNPIDIDTAFSCGKTDRSRYLKIGRGVPDDILLWIGKASSVGRPRWERFVAILEAEPKAEDRIRKELAAANDQVSSKSSDERFSLVFEAAQGRLRSVPASTEEKTTPTNFDHEIFVKGFDAPVARMKSSQKGISLTLLAGRRTGFLDWVESHRDEIVRRLVEEHEAEVGIAEDPET